MNKLYYQSVIIFTLLMAVAAWGIDWFETGILGINHNDVYPLFPAFFYIWGMMQMYIVKNAIKKDGGRVVNIYLLLKTLKNLFSGAIAIYVFLKVTDNRVYMLFTFAIFYLLNLVTESVYIYQMEKINKALKHHEQ